jgi:cell division protease FtsH
VGHAILAYTLPGCDPVHEVSVIPRGMAAGYTMTLPEEDKQHVLKSKLVDEITMMLGGRVAELLTLKDVSTGAVNDLQKATEVAREMVTKYGMSDELGPVFLSDKHEVFLGREFGQQSAYSEETAAKVDAEVKKILESAFTKAKEVLTKNKNKLIAISEVLMAREKLSGTEFEELFEKGTLTESEKPKDAATAKETPAEKPKPKEGQAREKDRPAKGTFDEGYDPN